MINLLPKEYIDKVKKEYGMRRLVIIFGFIVAISVISISLLSPSYIFTKINEKDAVKKYEVLKQNAGNPENITDSLKKLAAASELAGTLKSNGSSVSFYELLRLLQSKSGAIRITEISFSNKTKEDMRLTLKGVAKTRDSLTAFGKLLSSQPNLKDVDLPISNFAKDIDINFTVMASVSPEIKQ